MYEKELQAMIKAAQLSGDIIMEVYRKGLSRNQGRRFPGY